MKRMLSVGAVLLGASAASAQSFSRSQRLLLSEGTLRGSPRVMGIAGAYVGLAEGAEGLTRNPAAAAAKDPTYKADFNIDFAFTMHFLPPGATAEQDWDSDGLPDQSAAGPFAFLGTQVIYVVGALQYKSFALGVGVDLQNFLNRTDTPGGELQRFHNVSYTHAFGTLSAAFWYDQILVGLGIESTHAFVGYAEQRPGDFIPRRKT
ncbi:MAG: hypothetical protein JNG84_05105 [Archangium sp.]|nr:hypothetical protein [Archangium sp.]